MTWYSISPLILQKLIWIPTRLSLRLFGHLEIEGLDNLKDLKTNVIFACNHTSEMDPLFVPASLSFGSQFSPIFYASREKGFYTRSGWRQLFYGGLFFRMWGAYPVFVGLNNYEKSLVQQIAIVKDGGNLCVFPEGKTTPNGVLQPAKGGIAYLAEYTGRPIVPVGISGSFGINPGKFFGFKQYLKITFGKPIYIQEITEQYENVYGADDFSRYKGMAQYVMNRIGELLHEQSQPFKTKLVESQV